MQPATMGLFPGVYDRVLDQYATITCLGHVENNVFQWKIEFRRDLEVGPMVFQNLL